MTNMIFTGFGGQGILFAGKIITYAGMLAGKQVSWLPSYGPEMRGGTANCSICLDDQPIGCPLVTQPDIVIAMNAPSFQKFIGTLVPGGSMIYDSSLIEADSTRDDVHCHGIPATGLATDLSLQGLANIIMLGFALQKVPFATLEEIQEGIKKCVPASKQHLLKPNLRALQLGYDYNK